MLEKEVHEILKKLLWDYDINTLQIYELILGKREKVFHFTREKFFIRMLEHLTWNEIFKVLPVDIIKELLTEETISKLRFPGMKAKYEYARKVLHKLPVSSSIWYNQDHQKSRCTILSDRWYSS